jgi:mRNA interferase MazF
MKIKNYKWKIFTANLNPVKGSEQRGSRPVLIISDETFNQTMPVITILPITSLKEGRKVYPNEVLLPKGAAGLARDSLVLTHQIRTISKNRLQNILGQIEEAGLKDKINNSLRVHLNL